MNKIFIVGCPRSGTTLLQSLLASHSHIVSFPETHLFSRTVSINPLVQAFTVYRKKHYETVNRILHDFGVDSIIEPQQQIPIFRTKQWVKYLLPQLDKIGEAYRSGHESFLLEKTPRHLHFIDFLHQADPSACFIHLIRNGEDVVASLSEATANHPGDWAGKRSVKKSVFWWNRSIQLSEKYIGKNRNIHIRYENLVDETEAVLNYLCDEIGIHYEKNMTEQYHNVAASLINQDEAWKAKNTRKEISTTDKFAGLPKNVRQTIQKSLLNFDYRRIDINQFK
ncbi:MAG: sulfotransferase [Gracilimonas sp.]|uniref:sulfotransferase family protein n=1 Tax=Gracilimonas sp. TaxID=1974203 RepID=UPI0019973DAE|nr:sulfotransferase [Gracilimonas sp.]MBD3616006.1 sulfotransferase [Gracilimonas sp.]